MPPKKYESDEARKQAKKERELERSKSRINIKGQIDRWNLLKSEKQLASDEDVAEFLFNR